MVDGNATDEGEGEVVFPIQAQNGEEHLEGHVMSGGNPSIGGSDRKVEAGKANVKIEDDSSKVSRARTRKAVAKDKNKVIQIEDRVQENIEESVGWKGKDVLGKLDMCCCCLLANHAVEEPKTKAKLRKPPWNKGLKKRAPAKFESRIEESAHDENMTYCDAEVVENIASNLGEQNTDSAGLAGDEDSGVYTDRVPHDADYEHNIGELNTDVTGLADDEKTGINNDRVSCDSDDEHNFGEPNTDVACLADDEDSGVYNDRVSRDSDDEHDFDELNTDVTGLPEDQEIGIYNDRISRGSGAGDNFGEQNPDPASVADDKDAGVLYHGSSRGSGGELDVGELHTDAAVAVDNEGSVVYHQRDFHDSGDRDSVGDLHTDAAGAADDEDAGAYHHRDFAGSGNEDGFGELNTDVAGVADDDGAGLYHHGAFSASRDENDVGELDTDDAGVADDEDDSRVYHEGAFRNSADEDIVAELNTEDNGEFHHGATGDEGKVGELNEENRVYEQRAFRDSGDEDDVGEPATAAAGVVDIEDTEVYHHPAIRDASLQSELADVTGVGEDEEVRIHNNQAFHHPRDEPMSDAPGDPLDHPSRDISSDLTSYSTGSHSPNIIAKVIGCSEGLPGMELPDQNMAEPLGIIISDVKDVTMGEAENGAEEGAEDGQGETTQSIL